MLSPDHAMSLLLQTARKGSAFDLRTVEERGFTSPCWIYHGKTDRDGYGIIARAARKFRLHRLILFAVGRPIPDGLVVDHLCKQKACFNPDHLDIVTAAENSLRSLADHPENTDRLRSVRPGRRTIGPEKRRPGLRSHCKRGHEFTPENTRMQGNGRWQLCVECCREAQRLRRERKASAAVDNRDADAWREIA